MTTYDEETLSEPAAAFNAIIQKKINYDQIEEILKLLTDKKGLLDGRNKTIKDIWRPDMWGIVISVDDNFPSEEIRKQLQAHSLADPGHTQTVKYVETISGLPFVVQWGEKKQSCMTTPEGFQRFDGIHVHTERGGLGVTLLEKSPLQLVREHITMP